MKQQQLDGLRYWSIRSWSVVLRVLWLWVGAAIATVTVTAMLVNTPVVAAQSGDLTAHQTHAGSSGHAMRARPQLAISAAFDPQGRLWVVGVNTQGQLTLRQAPATDPHALSAPRVIANGDDVIAAEGESRPKIAFGPNQWVVISYTRPLAKPYTGEIRMLHSSDGGQQFSAPLTVHQDRQVITHRFESIAFDRAGTLHTLWIDKRDAEQLPTQHGVSKGYVGAAVYRNTSVDGGRTFSTDRKVADHSCECCRIALAEDPQGEMVAVWRQIFAPQERDHGFVRLTPHSAPVVRATEDHWALDVCPHHGPALALQAAGGYHLVWFAERAGVGRVRYGRLTAEGRPSSEPIAIPDSGAEHADIQSAGDSVVISWRSFDGQKTLWQVWESNDGGRQFTARTLGKATGDNDYPLLLKRGATIFGVWQTNTGIRVEQITQ